MPGPRDLVGRGRLDLAALPEDAARLGAAEAGDQVDEVSSCPAPLGPMSP